MAKTINLKTAKNVNQCLKYVGNGNDNEDRKSDFNIFTSMLKETKFSAKYAKYDKYFPEDKDYRDIWTISISRNGTTIRFTFGSSIVDSMEHKEPDLYSILATIDLEYRVADQSFHQFCDDLGCNEDSIQDKKMYDGCVKQSKKLQKIFSETEAYSMPQ